MLRHCSVRCPENLKISDKESCQGCATTQSHDPGKHSRHIFATVHVMLSMLLVTFIECLITEGPRAPSCARRYTPTQTLAARLPAANGQQSRRRRRMRPPPSHCPAQKADVQLTAMVFSSMTRARAAKSSLPRGASISIAQTPHWIWFSQLAEGSPFLLSHLPTAGCKAGEAWPLSLV